MANPVSAFTLIDVKIDRKSKQPIYKQVYESIRLAILKGNIRAGEQLPATRQLSDELKISRNIISLAYEQLILEGYVVGKVGAGTFVSSTIPDDFIKTSGATESIPLVPLVKSTAPSEFNRTEVLPRNTVREEIVPFQNAVPGLDIFPFKSWNKIAAREYKAIRNLHLGYDDAMGYLPLRENIASYLRSSRGVRCEAGQVLIVNGAQQALSLCSHALLGTGDRVMVEDPGYIGARAAFRNYGAKIIPVPVEADGLDVTFLRKQKENAKLIYLTPGHQYPLGGTLALDKRIELLNWAANRNTWIIEDDYDSELRYFGRPLAAMQGLDQSGKVIYVGTFSKVLFPGLRVAYMVLPTLAMSEHFKSIKAVFDRQLPIMEQVITNTFMHEGHFVRHLRKMRIEYLERQKVMIRAIEKELSGKLHVEEQPAGMHLIGWLPKKSSDQEISNALARKGIIANPLSEYTLKFRRDPGLLLGYTAFNKFKIRHYVQKMGMVIK